MATSIFNWVAVLLCLGFVSPLTAAQPLDDLLSRAAKGASAPLIPRERFLQRSPILQVSLSPDGAHLAYRLESKRHQEVWRYSLSDQTHLKLLSAKRLGHLHWSADSQHLYYSDGQGLFAVPLTQANAGVRLLDISGPNSEFLGPDEQVADAAWVHKYQPVSRKYQLLRVTLDGEAEVVFESNYPIAGFLTNAKGKLAVVKEQRDLQMQISKVDGRRVEPLLRCIALDPCRMHRWDPSAQELLVSAYFDQDLLSLFAIDMGNGSKRLLHQDPQGRFDIHSVAFTADNRPSFVSYEDDYVSHVGLDPTARKVLAGIQNHVASKLLLIEHDREQQHWLVTDADPRRRSPNYLLYDARHRRWQRPLDNLFQDVLSADDLAPRASFWFSASDGLPLQGYLTLPKGIRAKETPLVVMPHGGPWNRSKGAFNPHAQFLANRGYAVFEPNFRSSTGFGRRYLLSANKDFGWGRVHQDMLDGLSYLLSLGIGDPEQLAFAGHSFGGFSALTALAFEPARFKVGFAAAAPADLVKSIQRYTKQVDGLAAQRRKSGFKTLMVDLGDPDDRQRLYTQSPAWAWQQISRPVYLWAGEQDDRVAIEDVRDIALRLKAAGKPVSFMSAPREGHSPSRDIAREAYWYMLERGLARHLSGRWQRHTSPLLRQYMDKHTVFDHIDTAGLTKDAP